LAALLGNKSIMMMGNHGVIVCASTVAEAFDIMYYLERSCRTLVMAYQTGQPLHVMSHDIAEKSAQEWEAERDQFHVHFSEMKNILDQEDPSYAQ
jgi:ribulose-5-phosphate 4-epimerase/fuculose-1-phosphate aldolase